MSEVKNVLRKIQDEKIKFVDLRFTDTRGKEQHVSIPANAVDQDFFKEGKMFDGSSIAGWKSIDSSDMILMPDATTAMLDPFRHNPTLMLRCDVIEPSTQQPYERDPRSIAKRAEAYLQSTGLADTCLLGPEPEFFVFDNVTWEVQMHTAHYQIDSEEGAWSSNQNPQDNKGHRPSVKGGYFPVPPVDSSQDIRSMMCLMLEKVGLVVEAHHHEVATANQNEISTRCNSLLKKADEMMLFKYVIHNVAHSFGKTATFMPKPLVGDNGSGMHCHISLLKQGKQLFSGDKYAGLSQEALYFIGGVIHHARAVNAFTNATTNSYKRLVPGFEAPVMLCYSSRNRSASIRIPHVANPDRRRIEVRFPDAASNPYLAFSALMMAGLDGIQQKILPGDPMEKDLYELEAHEKANLPTVAETLDQALNHLSSDMGFLMMGNVFTRDFIESYIALKRKEVQRLLMATHPLEFEMYYSL